MPELKTRLLIADDEPKYVLSLRFILERQGYEVVTAADGQLAVEIAERERPGLILLDVRIPKLDGYQICRRIRQFSLAPILMLTALGQDTDISAGLAAGADDYLVKPYNVEILLARLESLQRWSTPGKEEPGASEFRLGDLRVSYAGRRAWLGTRELPLTTAEYRLLHELAHAPGERLPQDELLYRIWSPDRTNADQIVPLLIYRLRQKIETNPAAPQYILGNPSQGYSLGPATAGAASKPNRDCSGKG
jgi:DNA-binding response OmpR family regulator